MLNNGYLSAFLVGLTFRLSFCHWFQYNFIPRVRHNISCRLRIILMSSPGFHFAENLRIKNMELRCIVLWMTSSN